MPINRYGATDIYGGRRFGVARYHERIAEGIRAGQIDFVTHITSDAQRIDTIAGQVYGDATLWWVIAAASDIGWAPQVPSGIVLRVPTDLAQVAGVIGLT